MDIIWPWILDHVKNSTAETILISLFAVYLFFNNIGRVFRKLKTVYPTIKEHINIVRNLSNINEISPKLDKIIDHQEALSKILPGLQKTIGLILQIQNIARYDCTPEGNCISANEVWSKWTGISERDALGQGWVVAIHEDDRQRVCAEWDDAILHKRPFVSKFRYKHIHTNIITNVISNSYNITDEDGKLIYIIGIAKIVDSNDVNMLIVDDEKDARELQKILCSANELIKCDEASSLAEALYKAKHNNYDIITLDLNLVDSTPHQTLSAIPELKMNNAKIAVLTGAVSLDQVTKIKEHQYADAIGLKQEVCNFKDWVPFLQKAKLVHL